MFLPDERIIDIRGTFDTDDSDGVLMTYAGVAVFSQEIFDYLPHTPQNYSIITALLEILRSDNQIIHSYIHKGYWNDLGTISQLL